MNLTQGSAEWQAHRVTSQNASEAPAMMGVSSYVTRSELLRQKALGVEPEHDDRTLERFADGHKVEAMARPIAEAIIDQELFPATAAEDNGPLSASFDGIVMDESIIWECKQMNEGKAAAVREGRVPDEDHWQVVQQLVVSRAEKCCYMVTDGTEEGSLHCWATLDPEDEAKLRAGWAQFQRDLDAYEPPEAEAPKPVGKTPDNLPALQIQVTGMVQHSNLNQFREHAMSVIDGINTDLQTDEDFATAEATAKWLKKDVEERLAAAKDQALQQTADIYELLQTIDHVCEHARKQRLRIEKLVKDQKESIRGEIAGNARNDWMATLDQINAGLGGKVRLPEIPIDIGGAMKGKRTVATLRDAAETEVARAKIEAHALADRMRANLEILRSEAKGYETLFSDAQALVQKDPDDLRAQIKTRISEHKEAEQKRLDAERERIRADEQAKAQREAEAKAAEERRQQEAAERQQAEAAEKQAKPVDEPPPTKGPTAEELRESARRMRERAEYAERNSDRNAERAKASEIEARAAALEKSEPRQPHLMVELGEWQKAHGISNEAMDALIGILRNHTTALDMAA
ncbi:MAG TPA: YqaJ viral recombinase family protein [Acidimicrobiia bacterium]